MVKGLYTAYTGMVNEQNRMDIMTNNLANASTVGYKRKDPPASPLMMC
ncbi:MAG: flagellar basal body protein [Waltera sp.]